MKKQIFRVFDDEPHGTPATVHVERVAHINSTFSADWPWTDCRIFSVNSQANKNVHRTNDYHRHRERMTNSKLDWCGSLSIMTRTNQKKRVNDSNEKWTNLLLASRCFRCAHRPNPLGPSFKPSNTYRSSVDWSTPFSLSLFDSGQNHFRPKEIFIGIFIQEFIVFE